MLVLTTKRGFLPTLTAHGWVSVLDIIGGDARYQRRILLTHRVIAG